MRAGRCLFRDTRRTLSKGRWAAGAGAGAGLGFAWSQWQHAASAEGPKSGDVIPLAEVRRHATADSLWVTYQGEVYDVTHFLGIHPGGKEPLLGAGGLDLAAFWENYKIHFRTDKAIKWLEKYRVGSLSDEDTERAEDAQDPQTAAYRRRNTVFEPEVSTDAIKRSHKRANWATLKVWMCATTLPFFILLRVLVRTVGVFIPPLAHGLASILPISVPGYGGAEPLAPVAPDGARRTVAVVGGGISGCGAAYSLQQSGYDVVLYEGRDILGGNAQVHTFTPGGAKVSQDLSVLFWAPELYRNYCALLAKLGVQPEVVRATYALHTNKYGKSEWFTPPGTDAEKVLVPSLKDRFPTDFERFDTMCKWVRRINFIFTWDARPSFYKHTGVWSYFNPLNYIPLKTLCRLFGISREWYDTVLIPFHGWNFSTIHIEGLPAVAIAALDEVVPMSRTREHGSWGEKNSTEVFDKMTEGIETQLGSRVMEVNFPRGRVEVTDDQGRVRSFDRIVFAAQAGMVCNMLQGANWLERALLEGVRYHDDYERADWKDWLENPVHTDTGVVPGSPEQKRALMDHLSFIVDYDVNVKNAEYTHILGSWSPAAKKAGKHGAPMFMTQSPHHHREIKNVEATMSAPRAHPDLCVQNMLITQMLRLVQGRRGAYFCSNWSTAGNGHDLSFLAGLCVAGAIGAQYPFPDNATARLDYDRLASFMGVNSPPYMPHGWVQTETPVRPMPAAAKLA